jgi:hypothetical protein
MKKIEIFSLVLLSIIFLTGCAKSDNKQPELKIKTSDIIYESTLSVQGMSKKLTIYQDGKIEYKNNLPGNSIGPIIRTIPKEEVDKVINVIEKSDILNKKIIEDSDNMTLCESNSSWFISVGGKSKNFSLSCGNISAKSKTTLETLEDVDLKINNLIIPYLKQEQFSECEKIGGKFSTIDECDGLKSNWCQISKKEGCYVEQINNGKCPEDVSPRVLCDGGANGQ